MAVSQRFLREAPITSLKVRMLLTINGGEKREWGRKISSLPLSVSRVGKGSDLIW
jgi:hypothetical protein